MRRHLACRDVEEGGTGSAVDPLQELAGWHAEPMLLRRLPLYIAEGALEVGAVSATMVVAQLLERDPSRSSSSKQHQEFFKRLLVLPLVVAILRLAWCLSLLFGYCSLTGASTPQIIKRRGRFQRRSFWTCSAAMLTCFSCLLMMWHTIMFLLLTGYAAAPSERQFIWVLFAINAMCTMIHWLFWRDFVRNYRDSEDEEPAQHQRHLRLEHIYRMYKAKDIDVCKFEEVAPARSPSNSPGTCMVCIEDFGPSDHVSVLPCGHFYHPACANKWLCEKWACPLRCTVDPQQRVREKAEAAAAPAPELQPSSAAARLSAAARVAAARQGAVAAAAAFDDHSAVLTPPDVPTPTPQASWPVEQESQLQQQPPENDPAPSEPDASANELSQLPTTPVVSILVAPAAAPPALAE